MTDLTKAIRSLRPNTHWILCGDDYAGLEWLDTEQPKPTEAELIAELAKLEAQAELDAKAEEAATQAAHNKLAALGLTPEDLKRILG